MSRNRRAALQKLSWRREPEGGMPMLLVVNRGGDIAIKQVALSDAG
ncbi:MAG TPA: hypothetical protein VNJ47_04420 [Nevskiales bacterium]|nr:hypothetical protein [Nevskiales bacterium]